MILRPLTAALPPTPRLFTLQPGLSCLHICPFDGSRGNGAPLCLFYPRPCLSPPCQSRPRRPALLRDLPGGLAEIHGATCPNVDAKRKNVRSKVTLKGKRARGQAGAMGWRGRADSRLRSDPGTNGQMRRSSALPDALMNNCKQAARELRRPGAAAGLDYHRGGGTGPNCQNG